jgi:MFS family permease
MGQAARTATLVGTVTDSTGAAVPGAVVTVVNSETRLESNGVTNTEDGYYILFVVLYLLSKVTGLDLRASSFYSMLPFLAMATCSPVGGWIADTVTRRYGRRAGRCGIGVLGLAGAAMLIALATQVESARIASMFLACGVGSL